VLRWRPIPADIPWVRSRRATVPQPAAAPIPDDGYRNLTVAEVLADLASLDREQLLLVKSLEEAGERRPVILHRIGDLLVVQEAAEHVRAVANGRPAPAVAAAPSVTAAPSAPVAPPPPVRDVSPDLLTQMGGLLAKNAARQTEIQPPQATQVAWPPPVTDQATAVPLAPPTKGGRKAAKAAAKVRPPAAAGAAPTTPPVGGQGKSPPPAPNGLIVPSDGRRSRSGKAGRRGAKILIGLVIAALLAAGGAVFWKQTHPNKSVATTVQPTRDLVADRLVKAVPAGYAQRPDSAGETGPSDLAKAVRDDGAPGAQAALTQDGFLHGYRRLWSTADKHDLLVVLYHFRTAAGATAYVQRMAALSRAGTKPAPAALAVTGIPGSVGWQGTTSAGQVAAAYFARGVYAVGVLVDGPVASGLAPIAQQMAVAQYSLLPAG
jgi:hypothetical protein